MSLHTSGVATNKKFNCGFFHQQAGKSRISIVQVIESFPLCYSLSFFFYCSLFVVSCLLFAFCLSAFLLPPHFHSAVFLKNLWMFFFSLHECRLTRKRRDSAKCFEALGLSLTLILLLLSAAVRLLFRRLRLAIHSRPSVPFPWRQHHILRPSHMRLLLRQLHLPLIRCPLQPLPMRQYKTRAFQWLLPQLHILAPVLVLVELICLPQPPPIRQQVVVPQQTPIRQ